MKNLKTYKQLFEKIIDDNDYQEYLEIVDRHFVDIERSQEELDWFLETIEKLQKDGGKIYRLLFVLDEKYIDTDNFGEHWSITGDFSSFYNSLSDDIPDYYDEDEDDYLETKPYIVIANIETGQIDIDSSLEYFSELPYEYEINLINNPTNYEIVNYEQYLKDKGEWKGYIGH